MTLTLPVAISVVGDALQVRHLRAAGKSWAVWTVNDNGGGELFVVRERTANISVIGGLRTDGSDFSERVIPLPARKIVNFHCLELATNEVAFLISDGKSVFTFLWNVLTNTILQPVVKLADGDLPSQFEVTDIIRRFYVRNRDVIVKVGGGAEATIIDPSSTEALDIDVVRKAETSLARYAGVQAINRDLALPFLADASSVIVYNSETEQALVSEALPSGTVGYFTFDSVDFSGTTMLNKAPSPAFNATLVGSAPASVAGQVGQARDFVGGGGNGHYDLGNPSALQIVGDLTISFWINADNFNQRVNPYAKAYGGEGTITLEDVAGGVPGYFNFFYGSGGGDANPYIGYGSLERITAGRWWHATVVRDMTNRFVRWFFDGQMVSHATAFVTPVASGQSASIGRGYTGQIVDGRLDEMLIINQALSPQQVNSLFEKGKAAAKADTTRSGSATRLVDSSGGARHGYLSSFAVPVTGAHAQRRGFDGLVMIGCSSYAANPSMTVEARFIPKWGEAAERPLFSNRIGTNSIGGRTQGTVEVSYTPDRYVRFRFETATATVELRQTGGSQLRFGELNHIALVHTFGAGASSMIVVNGDQVPVAWVGGSGNESPTLLAAAPSISMNPGDQLLGLRVSNVAKSLTDIRNYLRGRS